MHVCYHKLPFPPNKSFYVIFFKFSGLEDDLGLEDVVEGNEDLQLQAIESDESLWWQMSDNQHLWSIQCTKSDSWKFFILYQ